MDFGAKSDPIFKASDKYTCADDSVTVKKEPIMAAKLVIVKQKRASTDVAFFTAPTDLKASAMASGTVAVTGERNIGNGLVKIRTVFFPSQERFAEWEANQAVQTLIAARTAYNTANNIAEKVTVIDMPNFNSY